MQPPPGEDASASRRHADLGGCLFLAGEFTRQSHPIVVAANVAGCATLVASPDSTMQKQAIRDAVVDFVVNSVDEAVRILKNEIRKRATVAVCVGISILQMQKEMMERGVVPDLLAGSTAQFTETLPPFGAALRVIYPAEQGDDQAILTWTVAKNPAQCMPKLDTIAAECLHSEPAMQRWLRLSPRFAGRAALSTRSISCERAVASRIILAFEETVESGAISGDIDVTLRLNAQLKSLRFSAKHGT